MHYAHAKFEVEPVSGDSGIICMLIKIFSSLFGKTNIHF